MPNEQLPSDDQLSSVVLDGDQMQRARKLAEQISGHTLRAAFEIIWLRDRVEALEVRLDDFRHL